METYRTTARLVGALFLTATAAGILAVVVAPPVEGTGDLLAATAAEGARATTAALLELLMGVAVAAIAIVIHPVLRVASGRVAIGYVASRTVEGGLSALSAVAGLTILALGRDLVAGGSVLGDGVGAAALGDVLQATRDALNLAVLPLVFAVSALLLNSGLFGARLVPRWLSAWGLLAVIPYAASGLLAAYGAEELPVLVAPLGLQELVLAAWLLVKGFNASAFAARPATPPAPEPSAAPLAHPAPGASS